MKIITIFKDFNKVFEQISLEEFLMRIKLCVYANLILPMRQMLRDGNIKGYDNAKRTLPAGTPAGKFLGGRKWQYLVDYISVIVLDFDKLTEDEMIRLKKLINQCIYTLACFVSPSGNGLKVMVCVNSGPEDHLKAFLSVQQFYQTLTGVKIDP